VLRTGASAPHAHEMEGEAASDVHPALKRLPSDVDVKSMLRVASPDVNPFISRTLVMPWPQRLKICVTAVTLFPIRLILMFLLVLSAGLLAVIGTACLPRSAYELPLPCWRRVVLWPIRWLIRLVLVIMGVWVTVHGRPAPKSAAPIVVANHLSFLEPMFLVAALGGCAVSAIENLHFPIVGSILIALQCIFVVRDKQGISAGVNKRAKRSSAAVAPIEQPVASPSGSPAVARTLDTQAIHVNDASDAPAQPLPERSVPEGATTKIQRRALDPMFGQVLIFPEGLVTNGTAVVQVE
jgi:1-acyl-sn-glycerol-3-phosphate acyltransferase